jgi:hypothetical protein
MNRLGSVVVVRTMSILNDQLTVSADLAGRYSAAMRDLPGRADELRPLRDTHVSHVLAILELSCALSPEARDDDAVLDELRELERTAFELAREACLAAPAEQAMLLGFIAAARAAHGEALK